MFRLRNKYFLITKLKHNQILTNSSDSGNKQHQKTGQIKYWIKFEQNAFTIFFIFANQPFSLHSFGSKHFFLISQVIVNKEYGKKWKSIIHYMKRSKNCLTIHFFIEIGFLSLWRWFISRFDFNLRGLGDLVAFFLSVERSRWRIVYEIDVRLKIGVIKQLNHNNNAKTDSRKWWLMVDVLLIRSNTAPL